MFSGTKYLSRAAKLLAPTFALFLGLLSPLVRADYQAGLDAYNAGNYTVAHQEWLGVIQQSPDEVQAAILAETHYAIGMLYWMNQGVPRDYFEASRWLHKAAELGNAGAQGKLGFLYAEGLTVGQDYEQAFQWFSKAAQQGDVDGQYNLGIFYLNGWGIEQNKTMAAQYLAAASAQGDQDAEAMLQQLLPQTAMIPSQESVEAPDIQTDPADGKTGIAAVERGVRKAQSGVTNSEPDVMKSEFAVTGGELGAVKFARHSGLDPESIFLSTDWIMSQNPDHYTIQVIGLRDKDRLENLIQGHEKLAPWAIYTLIRGNLPLHMMVQGVYPGLQSVRQARDAFPADVQKPSEVWIRKFGKIQVLLEAEGGVETR